MNIGTLGIKITADTASLQTGMARTRTLVSQGATQLRSYANQWTKYGTAAGAAAAAAAAAAGACPAGKPPVDLSGALEESDT